MAFGKRNTPPAGAGAPASPRLSITPSLSANDAPPAPPIPPTPSYMPLDAYRVRERFEESRARLAARHEEKSARAKERFTNAQVRPFCLIPETYWSGKWAELLSSRLGLFPYEDWNVAFVAAGQASAALLDLPPHPGAALTAANAEIEKLLAEAELQLDTGYAGAERARNFSQYAQERDEIREKLTKLARRVLFSIDEDWQKSKMETAD